MNGLLSLGIVEAQGAAALLSATDAMLKAAAVAVSGAHRVGSGWVTVTVEGDPGAVEAAVATGRADVERASGLIYAGTIIQPDPSATAAMPHPTGLRPYAADPSRAVGLLETRGLTPLLVGADAMAKAAPVAVNGWAAIGGALCHAVVRGDVDSVREAVEAGRRAAAGAGEVFATLVLPVPSDGVETLLPAAPGPATAAAGTDAPIDALGILETTGYLAAVAAADAMVKDAGVTLLRLILGSGGRLGVLLEGPLEEVLSALRSGQARAESAGVFSAAHAVARPDGALVACFGGATPTATNDGRGTAALGLIETKSTVSIVAAVDQMMKTADVTFEGRLKAGAFLTAAVIRGDVAAVRVALDVGAAEASRRAPDVWTHLIPAPLEDVGRCLLHR